MTSPQTLVPEIRFEGFSSAWNRCSVGDVASVLGGNAWKSSEYADDGDYLVVTIANVSGDVYIDDTIGNHISCESPNGYLLHGEDILVSLTGNVGRVSKMSNTRGLLNQRVGKVIPNQSKITPDYLFHVLRNPIFEKAMIEAGQGAAQKNISNKDILAYSLAAPSEVKEQIDVANFLNSIDCLINLYQRKYDRLKNVKKSMLEKMFPRDGANIPEIRFAGFTDAWEQRKLGDMMNVTSVKRIHQSDWTDSGIRFLRARDIVAAAKGEEPSDLLYISKEKYEEYSALSGKVAVDDLLVTGVGTIGIPYLICNSEPLYFKDGNIIWFQNCGKINGKFFYYSFTGEQIQSFIKDSAGIGTVGTYIYGVARLIPLTYHLNFHIR